MGMKGSRIFIMATTVGCWVRRTEYQYSLCSSTSPSSPPFADDGSDAALASNSLETSVTELRVKKELSQGDSRDGLAV